MARWLKQRRERLAGQKSNLPVARVSKALWPAAARQAFASSRAYLQPRQRARPGSALETPLPQEPSSLVRVLETVDLSDTGVEHFLEMPGAQTGEIAMLLPSDTRSL